MSGETSLPAPVKRLQFALGFFSGMISRLFTSRELRRREALERWTAQWRKWVARLTSNNTEALDASAPTDLAPLKEAMMGQSRAHVVITLGPPPAASSGENPKTDSRHYWHAEIWYYPLDLSRRQAVAVTFDRDQVKSIDRFTGPPH